MAEQVPNFILLEHIEGKVRSYRPYPDNVDEVVARYGGGREYEVKGYCDNEDEAMDFIMRRRRWAS